MKKKHRFSGIFFLFILLFLPALVSADETILSNGSRVYSGDTFSLALLGTKSIGHDEMRSIADQIKAIRAVEKKFKSWGLKAKRKAHFRFFTDTGFPARDLWKAAGLPTDSREMDNLEAMSLSVIKSRTAYELAHRVDDLSEYYHLITSFSTGGIPREFFVNPSLIKGNVYNHLAFIIKEQRKMIENNLDKPLSGQLVNYAVSDCAAYRMDSASIWIPVKKPEALHRYLPAAIHEYGHHLFHQMMLDCLERKNIRKKWTTIQLYYISEEILALNEFFADYVAVANGYNKNISVHSRPRNQTKELKRLFSQTRTLKSFIEELANADKTNKIILSDAHTVLNPMRSMVWKMRLALGADTTDKIVIDAIKSAIESFFCIDIEEYPRIRLTEAGWGCFTLKNYPKDVKTENLRFLNFLTHSASIYLDKKQMLQYQNIVATIFQGYLNN